ncbi:hypothetical protein EDD18DRAFT_290613 [Armillaria luteobubalina]|uniref:Uncharacterized protein n=1 Tax=Armillaria luteobubalina TaxID=153913 RepID=A0AA39Q3C4_9AGAR|nr:hypothetical protein EDD18DRAFT_290613 [Armillaria luteobubalina]
MLTALSCSFGIADTHGGSPGSWRVYDVSCKPILTVFADNPCIAGAFSCSPAPIAFTALHLNGATYTCVPDVNSETCEEGSNKGIQFCCRSDGN